LKNVCEIDSLLNVGLCGLETMYCNLRGASPEHHLLVAV